MRSGHNTHFLKQYLIVIGKLGKSKEVQDCEEVYLYSVSIKFVPFALIF